MAYAAISAYWGLGGTWLLDTVGGSLETAGRSGTAGLLAAVWAAAVLKVVGAMIPVLYCGLSAGRPTSGPLSRPRPRADQPRADGPRADGPRVDRSRADRLPALWRWLRLLRILMWLEAAILILYGGVLTAAGLLVQSGVIASGADADQRALAWHAYLWDPLFLGWGLLVLVVLATTRPTVSRVT